VQFCWLFLRAAFVYLSSFTIKASRLAHKVLYFYSDKQEAPGRITKANLRRFKMVSTVTSATQTQPAAQSTPVNQKSTQSKPVNQKSTQSKPQPTTTDTVKLSNAALIFAQEATETPTQTLKEAMSGDTQAQRLLAKEAAAKATAT
jgi:hypothetical protein